MERGEPGDGLWAPHRRALTLGLVLTITFIASEALAIVTVMPVVARDLHGLALYGWVFSSFMLASLIGIVAAGRDADRHGPARPYVAGLVLFTTGLVVGGLAPFMWVLVVGPLPARTGRGSSSCRGLCGHRAQPPRGPTGSDDGGLVDGVGGARHRWSRRGGDREPPVRLAVGLSRTHPPGRRRWSDCAARVDPAGPVNDRAERGTSHGRRRPNGGRGGTGAGCARSARRCGSACPWR